MASTCVTSPGGKVIRSQRQRYGSRGVRWSNAVLFSLCRSIKGNARGSLPRIWFDSSDAALSVNHLMLCVFAPYPWGIFFTPSQRSLPARALCHGLNRRSECNEIHFPQRGASEPAHQCSSVCRWSRSAAAARRNTAGRYGSRLTHGEHHGNETCSENSVSPQTDRR